MQTNGAMDAALLQQLLQQAPLQQQQMQHQGGQEQLAALLVQQQQQQQQSFAAAAPGQYGFGQPGLQMPFVVPVPQPQSDFAQPSPFGVSAAQQQAGAFAMPVFLQQPVAASEPTEGSGTLPPAILQHQQAALARQQQAAAAAPTLLQGMQLPVMVPNSNGLQSSGAAQQQQQQQQQPTWAVLQHQAAAAVGGMPAMVAIPGLPPFSEQPAASTAHQQSAAAAAGMMAPQGAGQEQGGGGGGQATAKRRGRQPKDPSSLTEKQLRAREAQKRFREKQKRMMAETEVAVQATNVELERLRVSNESQKLKNEVLEQLLGYKEAQVHALEFQKQMDPPPRFTISGSMVDMMRREGIAGLFTPDVLLRYAVAGFTEHMDEQGEVKEPPPFDKVAEDWREMVKMVKEILDAARQGPAPDLQAAADAADAAAATAAAAQEVARDTRMADTAEFVELHSSSSAGGAKSGVAGAGPAASKDAAAVASADDSAQRAGSLDEVGQPECPRCVSFDRPASLGAAPAAAATAATAAATAAAAPGCRIEHAASGTGEALPDPTAVSAAAAAINAPSGSTAGSGGSGRRVAPITTVPQDVLPEVAAIAGEAPEDVLEAAEAKDDPIARFVLARILSQTAAHSHLQWDTLVEGASVQDGTDLYRFTGKQLRSLAHLMRRVGLMLWQQALLFPQHITKLGTLRLDDPNNLHVEAQDLDQWRGILRRLHCRPEQLRKIVAGHERYMARMKPVLEERKEAMDIVKHITELQLRHAWAPDASTASFVTSTTRLTEATSLVMQTISAQHAAYCELLIAIFYALTFPVQRPLLFVLSWPYFPQLQLLGRAAALELGLDISGYPSYSATTD